MMKEMLRGEGRLETVHDAHIHDVPRIRSGLENVGLISYQDQPEVLNNCIIRYFSLSCFRLDCKGKKDRMVRVSKTKRCAHKSLL